jgi:hypothetical protein
MSRNQFAVKKTSSVSRASRGHQAVKGVLESAKLKSPVAPSVAMSPLQQLRTPVPDSQNKPAAVEHSTVKKTKKTAVEDLDDIFANDAVKQQGSFPPRRVATSEDKFASNKLKPMKLAIPSRSVIVIDDSSAVASPVARHSLPQQEATGQGLLRQNVSFINVGGERFVSETSCTWCENAVVMGFADGSDALMELQMIDSLLLVKCWRLVALQGVIQGDELHSRFKSYDTNHIGMKKGERAFVVVGFPSAQSFNDACNAVQRTAKLQHVTKEVTNASEWVAWEYYAKQNIGENLSPPVEAPPLDNRKTKRAKSNEKAKDEVLVLYPPNQRDMVTIYRADLALLKPHEFLNDSVIAFYIKYLQNAIVPYAESHMLYCKQNVHIFSSFFYLKLVDQGYSAVRKWVADDMDLFKKDFLVVPINESLHWYLAIVRHAADPEKACFIVLDSLSSGSLSKTNVQTVLRQYLIDEWKAKKPGEVVPRHLEKIEAVWGVVPRQNNSSDCGVFLLHYIERFLLTHVLEKESNIELKNWFPRKEIAEKRKEIAKIINHLHTGKDELLPEMEKRLNEVMNCEKELEIVIPWSQEQDYVDVIIEKKKRPKEHLVEVDLVEDVILSNKAKRGDAKRQRQDEEEKKSGSQQKHKQSKQQQQQQQQEQQQEEEEQEQKQERNVRRRSPRSESQPPPPPRNSRHSPRLNGSQPLSQDLDGVSKSDTSQSIQKKQLPPSRKRPSPESEAVRAVAASPATRTRNTNDVEVKQTKGTTDAVGKAAEKQNNVKKTETKATPEKQKVTAVELRKPLPSVPQVKVTKKVIAKREKIFCVIVLNKNVAKENSRSSCGSGCQSKEVGFVWEETCCC